MKIVKEEILSNHSKVQDSPEILELLRQIRSAIAAVVWPPKSDNFKLNPVVKGNGVKPIKDECMAYLRENGWELESRLDLVSSKKPGKVDALFRLEDGRIAALEWETGNISSSHRALNKLALGAMKAKVALGVLILPSRDMYRFLTDRVGNFIEIEPYFDIWKSLVTSGVLIVIAVEHDSLDPSVRRIPKGTDGRAKG